MKLRGTLVTLLLAQPAVFVCAGCEAQVSDRYDGEPLLTIRGNIAQSGVVTSDLVPVLGFRDRVTGPLIEPLNIRLVDGHVTGEFPAKFQVDFTQPPPDSAFYSPTESEPEGGPWTQGEFYLVPRNHPPAYAYHMMTSQTLPDPDAMACDAGDNCGGEYPNSYILRNSACETENHCKITTYQCHNEPCKLLYAAGDPSLETSDQATHHESAGAHAQGGLEALTYYDPQDINHFYRAVYYCGDFWKVPTPGGFGGLDKDSHGIPSNRYCAPLSKTGETFPDVGDIPWRASTFFVVYSKLDGLYFPGGDLTRSALLARGYNVIKAETVLSPEESIPAINCLEDVEVTAINEINAAYGTKYVPLESVAYYPDGFPVDEFTVREQQLMEQCPEILLKWHTVPPSEPIEIELGSSSTSNP